jgi:mRNA-degrading endonuclease RelE of RelBE toxin-antitoxin system
MAPRKRRPPATTTEEAASPKAVRIGFAPEAREAFQRLSLKVRNGLRRKLKDIGANEVLGKPLVRELQGFRRVSYGRLRAVAYVDLIIKTTGDVTVVIVVRIGPRAEGSRRDPYRVAVEALGRGDKDAIELLNLIVREVADADENFEE